MKLSSKVKTRRETFVKKRSRGTLSDEGSQFRERTETLKSMKEQYRERQNPDMCLRVASELENLFEGSIKCQLAPPG